MADAHTGSEVRLYIDTGFSLERQRERCDDSDAERAALALLPLNMQTITRVEVGDDISLTLVFDQGELLRIDGSAAPFTTGEPWWLAAQ